MDNKYNIENTDTIDGLAYNEPTKMLILQLADGMDWSDMNRHFELLRQKLNTYLWYIDSKQYEEKYPDVDRIELRVNLLFKEPDACMALFEKVGEVLRGLFENSALVVERGERE
ncbi:MAG: hypothetical protein K6F71_02860 [Ruminococcus sp.]|uniref:DUF6572 domain-containing protein n=1 Tax=Ruminococcus sp. TaxID=41978 RepID=UPI0025F1EE6D|nr:DUF6572 domain-containing protein [Ruminococcus sp.]MCR5539767.1 hypothetical protein [Ruminococcus sp.]